MAQFGGKVDEILPFQMCETHSGGAGGENLSRRDNNLSWLIRE